MSSVWITFQTMVLKLFDVVKVGFKTRSLFFIPWKSSILTRVFYLKLKKITSDFSEQCWFSLIKPPVIDPQKLLHL